MLDPVIVSNPVMTAVVYIVGMLIAFPIIYWHEDDWLISFVPAMLWPILAPLCLIYLPFYGLAKLVDRIKG